jgi:hypothetical protein
VPLGGEVDDLLVYVAEPEPLRYAAADVVPPAPVACEIVTIRVFAIRRPPRRPSYYAPPDSTPRQLRRSRTAEVSHDARAPAGIAARATLATAIERLIIVRDRPS